MFCERCQIINNEHFYNSFVKRLRNVKEELYQNVSLKLGITLMYQKRGDNNSYFLYESVAMKIAILVVDRASESYFFFSAVLVFLGRRTAWMLGRTPP